jgi:hypothetical protein
MQWGRIARERSGDTCLIFPKIAEFLVMNESALYDTMREMKELTLPANTLRWRMRRMSVKPASSSSRSVFEVKDVDEKEEEEEEEEEGMGMVFEACAPMNENDGRYVWDICDDTSPKITKNKKMLMII